MTIDNKIRDEKLQYDIIREAAKISALSSGKNDKYEYLASKEILLSDQSRVIKREPSLLILLQEKLQKNKQKIIEDHDKKQIKALEKHGKQLIRSSGVFNNLTCYYTGKNAPKYFFRF